MIRKLPPKRIVDDEDYGRFLASLYLSAKDILASETGVPMPNGKAHLDNHSGFLQSWIKVLSRDPMGIFTASKAADKISEYMIGLEKSRWLAKRSTRSGATATTAIRSL